MVILEPISKRKIGIYEKYIKRMLDIICVLTAIAVFWWLFVIVALAVRIKLGSPVLFKQYRPGLIDPLTGQEKIFKLYKFRTMTDKRDSKGVLLPDDKRLTGFGKILRATSLDELPECINILNGTMSIVGPRPQLVRDMTFMSPEQRIRHTARPGLTGLAQVNGRNAILWEEKLTWDLKYVEKVNLLNDAKIICQTVVKVFFRHDGITEEGSATATDFGDYLLKSGKVTKDEYDKKQLMARKLIEEKKNDR